ncbi:MAG: SpoIID/LytB domain-containing protein [Candidatus Roizmanbacteria bacterium]
MRYAVVLVLCISILLFVLPLNTVHADDFDTITKQLEDTKRDLVLSVSATQTNEAELNKLRTRIQDIRASVEVLGMQVAEKKQAVSIGDATIAKRQKLLSTQMASHYKLIQSQSDLSLINFLTTSLEDFSQTQKQQQTVVEQNQNLIIQLAIRVRNTEEAQLVLESQQARLASFKTELDRQSAFLAGEITNAKQYQNVLVQKISELSSRQKSIIDARSAQFTANANNDDLSDDDRASSSFDPGFRPAFAFFSIGAYTHRLGMSQFGAKGRADAGQNFRDILKAYFPGSNLEEKGEIGGNIKVSGSGEINFESTYLYGIAEMPSSWSKEALKAQAILARTYALRYTGGLDREICTTESCQVYSPSKSANVPQAWKEAVDETRGMVLKDGGDYAKAYYSSTTGGYLISSGWDTTDGQSGDFLNTAWERKAKSPWFYKAWYRSGYSNTSDSCGRTHPWLNEQEMADILNAWQVRKSGSNDEVGRILPITINQCSIAGASGDPYSMDEMAQVADKYGGRYTSVSEVSYSFSKDGYTSEIRFNTNRGQVSISGSEFKPLFNLRAPGNISIRNALYAVEKR